MRKCRSRKIADLFRIASPSARTLSFKTMRPAILPSFPLSTKPSMSSTLVSMKYSSARYFSSGTWNERSLLETGSPIASRSLMLRSCCWRKRFTYSLLNSSYCCSYPPSLLRRIPPVWYPSPTSCATTPSPMPLLSMWCMNSCVSRGLSGLRALGLTITVFVLRSYTPSPCVTNSTFAPGLLAENVPIARFKSGAMPLNITR